MALSEAEIAAAQATIDCFNELFPGTLEAAVNALLTADASGCLKDAVQACVDAQDPLTKDDLAAIIQAE